MSSIDSFRDKVVLVLQITLSWLLIISVPVMMFIVIPYWIYTFTGFPIWASISIALLIVFGLVIWFMIYLLRVLAEWFESFENQADFEDYD